jgi:hypothetical protein
MGNYRGLKKKWMTQIRLQKLPFDVQVLLNDMVEVTGDYEMHQRLWRHRFTVRHVDLSRFPKDITFSDYRNEDYATEMIGSNLPPVILCGDLLLDGKHRVWAALKEQMKKIAAIDLSEIGFTYNFQAVCKLKAKR